MKRFAWIAAFVLLGCAGSNTNSKSAYIACYDTGHGVKCVETDNPGSSSMGAMVCASGASSESDGESDGTPSEHCGVSDASDSSSESTVGASSDSDTDGDGFSDSDDCDCMDPGTGDTPPAPPTEPPLG